MLRNIYYYLIITKSGLFDRRYYLKEYPDVRKKDIDPLWHFLRIGWREGRNPSEDFDMSMHLAKREDTKDSSLNPLIQYIKSEK